MGRVAAPARRLRREAAASAVTVNFRRWTRNQIETAVCVEKTHDWSSRRARRILESLTTPRGHCRRRRVDGLFFYYLLDIISAPTPLHNSAMFVCIRAARAASRWWNALSQLMLTGCWVCSGLATFSSIYFIYFDVHMMILMSSFQIYYQVGTGFCLLGKMMQVSSFPPIYAH